MRTRDWQRGETVNATVAEILDQTEIILRFGGGPDEPASQIMRVANQTGRPLAVGERLLMRVIEVEPLRFRYIDPIEQRRRGRIDVSV
jgi:hypothetical protein